MVKERAKDTTPPGKRLSGSKPAMQIASSPNSFRRSPRLTSPPENHRSSSKSTMQNTPPPNSVRRSISPPADGETKSPAKKNSKNALALTVHASMNNLDPNENCSPASRLRRSPRLTSSSPSVYVPVIDLGPTLSDEKFSTTKKYRGIRDLKSLGALSCSSPSTENRLVLHSSALGASMHVPAIELGPTFSDEKCSASKKYRGVFELKSLGALSPSEERGRVESSDSDRKRLRSREIEIPIGGPESDGGESGLVALLDEKRKPKKAKTRASSEKEERHEQKSAICFFIGEPVPEEEARERWCWRYELKVHFQL